MMFRCRYLYNVQYVTNCMNPDHSYTEYMSRMSEMVSFMSAIRDPTQSSPSNMQEMPGIVIAKECAADR